MSQSVQYQKTTSTQTHLANADVNHSSKTEHDKILNLNPLTQSFHSQLVKNSDSNIFGVENLNAAKTISSDNFSSTSSTNEYILQKFASTSLGTSSSGSHSYKQHTSKIVTLPSPRIPVVLNNAPTSMSVESSQDKCQPSFNFGDEKENVILERTRIITRPPKGKRKIVIEKNILNIVIIVFFL